MQNIFEEKTSGLISQWRQNFFSYIKYLERLDYLNISTLGPTGTSSEACAKYILSSLERTDGKYTLFSSYECAFQDLLEGNSNIFLIANAYNHIDAVYMSSKAQFLFSFVFQTPLYGVAKRPFQRIDQSAHLKLATHHAPESLLPWFLSGADMQDLDCEIVYADSTSNAAQMLHNGEVDLCVTTEIAAEFYHLTFISPTRPILMLWSVFNKKEQ